MIVPIEQFGKDHWSTLLYVESCCVDRRGALDDRRMRTHNFGGRNYPTILKNGAVVDDDKHDDWACLEDFCHAGILQPSDQSGLKQVVLTDYGWTVAGLLRRNRAEGGRDAEFVAPPNAAVANGVQS